VKTPALVQRRMPPWKRFGWAAIGAMAGLALVATLAGPVSAQAYTFTKLADSTEDGFDPFRFGCAATNARGDVPRSGSTLP
jgi:hypothetical protein